MKYKRLTNEELQALEKDFVNFLSSAQITATDWEKMKQNENEKSMELIDVFSDMVYDKILRKINFLEYRESKTLNIFKCEAEKIQLIGLRVKENSSLDLTAPNVFNQWNEHNNGAVTIVKSEKEYSKTREVELFEMLQAGCFITDNRLFDLLSKL